MFVKGHKINLNRRHTEATKNKLREYNLLHPQRYWLGKRHSALHKKRVSLAHRGQIPWNKNKKGLQKGYWAGKKRPNLSGIKSHLWRGGITPLNKTLRQSLEYKLWRAKVFERDNWTCQMCGRISRANAPLIIQADHIKPFAFYPELRFELSNGRTLCIKCHSLTETYKGRATAQHEMA